MAFLLADSGYDVWLGNYRGDIEESICVSRNSHEIPGNLYGTGHLTPYPDKADFWDFSWDEMAEHDLPAMLEHMMKVHFVLEQLLRGEAFLHSSFIPWIEISYFVFCTNTWI